MGYSRIIPYNDLPSLPPRIDIETPAVLKKALTAARELAQLKGAGSLIPNQAMLVNTVVLQEARASSEIENVITTNDALFKAFTAAATPDPATKEVLRYREASWAGFRKIKKSKKLDARLFVDIVKTLTGTDDGVRSVSGTTIKNAKTGSTIYTPPQDKAILEKMLAQLADFANRDMSIDPVIKLPLIHYQFEAIHPFYDGNGRTGRIINILFLVNAGLLDLPVLYLSGAIIEKKSAYYKLLRDVTEQGAWEPWILFMLAALEETAKQTSRRVMDIRVLMDETIEKAKVELPAHVYSKELIELLFHQPYTKVKFLVDAGLAERKTAAEYLKELEKIGVLENHKVGKENLYLNVELYELVSR